MYMYVHIYHRVGIFCVSEILPPTNVIISALSPPQESVVTASWETNTVQWVNHTVVGCTPCDPAEVSSILFRSRCFTPIMFHDLHLLIVGNRQKFILSIRDMLLLIF